jgi:hypothetical protein
VQASPGLRALIRLTDIATRPETPSLASVTNELQRGDKLAVAHQRLLDRPQRLGFIPTWWFWRDKHNWRLARVPFQILAGAAVAFVTLTKPGLVLAGLIPALALILSLGLFERYIRNRAKAQRAALPCSQSSVLHDHMCAPQDRQL